MTVREAQQRVSSTEFTGWLGLWRLRAIESVEREKGIPYAGFDDEDGDG